MKSPPDGAAGGGNGGGAQVGNVDDDGQTLWASPTAGPPLELKWLPAGSQVIVVLRLAELLTLDEGQKLFDGLGPAGEFVKTRLHEALGVELGQVEQVAIAFASDEAGVPQTTYVMHLKEPVPEATLVEAWGKPAAEERESKKFYRKGSVSYYVPAAGQGRVAVIAPGGAARHIGDGRRRRGCGKGSSGWRGPTRRGSSTCSLCPAIC